MNFKWRFLRDIVLGLCLIIDGLRIILLAGWPLRVSSLAMKWSGWVMRKWCLHQK